MSVQFDSNYPTLTIEATFPAPIGTVDITEYVITGQTFLGRTRELDRYDGSATFVLDDWDGRFTPGQTSGPYTDSGESFVRPRVPVRVSATWSATTYRLFRGHASAWRPAWDAEGHDPTCVLTCLGPGSILAAWTGAAVTAVGAGESTGDRIDRILTAAGAAPFGTALDTGLTTCAATTLAGNGASQITDVVDVEGGAFWYDGDGVATFEGRDALVVNSRSNTSQATFSDASIMFRSAEPVSPDDFVMNDITMQREGGFPQTSTDATSQSAYGVRSYSRTGLPAENDYDVLGVTEWNLRRWKDPDFRVAALTIDPAQSPAAFWPHALGRKIRDRVTINADVARSGISVDADAFIEGIGHTFSQNHWETTFQFTAAAPYDGLVPLRWDVNGWGTAGWYF